MPTDNKISVKEYNDINYISKYKDQQVEDLRLAVTQAPVESAS